MASEVWPAQDLESVGNCPYCGHDQRQCAYASVQDWAFGAAPGEWTYWDCAHCHALYLAPRPTPQSISRAYARYYTHVPAVSSPIAHLKQRLRNELWFHALGVDFRPRLCLPRFAGLWVRGLRHWIAEPFGLRQLAQMPKGLLIDVGCGNGEKLELAGRLGWRTCGIELDAAAVHAARSHGLDVRHGSYQELTRMPELADCIICSHVLEHVHEPLALLRHLRAALKPGGTLLLSTPNARSHLRNVYGPYWRGLEAPRHLAIADQTWLCRHLQALGFVCESVASLDIECAAESERMSRKGDQMSRADVRAAKACLVRQGPVASDRADAIQLVCHLPEQSG